MEKELVSEFILHSVNRMEENTKKIKKCFEDLEEKDIWIRPNGSSNSMGNLILHLCGNMHQYIISSIGNRNDIRERDKEFSTTGGQDREELIQKLSETVADATRIIQTMNSEGLLKVRSVQGYNYSGLGIILHVAEHYSYHTGQIIFYTKLLKDKDMGFYAGVNLNIKNKS